MRPQRGFTLLELSIVLVIIGLVVGGVVVGQELIKQAQVQKFATQMKEFESAFHTFRLKYNQLPGDMNNATSYWGKDNVRCPANPGTAATGGTCIGDGNGRVNESTNEIGNVWQHLALSGIIPGSYSGTYTVGTLRPGIDQPANPAGGGWIVFSPQTTEYYGVPARTRNFVQARTTNGQIQISTATAKALDSKIDNGIGGSGQMVSFGGAGATACLDGPLTQSSPVPDYQLGNTLDPACVPCYYFN